MNKTLKIIIGLVIILLIIWGISSLVGNRVPAVTETGPIKVGFMGALTGDAAVYGEPMQKVVAMAVGEINAGGGINGRQIEVVYEDDKCDAKAGVSAAQKLVNVDKVQVIIGSICSGPSLAAIPIVESAKVLLFSPTASSPDLTGKSLFFARDYPSDSSQGKVLANAAFDVKKYQKVALIQEQTDYASGIAKVFEATFQELGGTVVKEGFSSEMTDLRSQLAKLKDAKPDVLFVDTQAGPAASRILKQVRELKWNIPLIANDTVSGDKDVLAANGDFLEGALAAEFNVSGNDRFQTLISNYKTKYGEDMPYQQYGQTEYDSVYLLKDAIVAVGYNGEKIANWLRSVKDWPGASGLVTIDSDGDRVGGHVLKVIKDGKVELVNQ